MTKKSIAYLIAQHNNAVTNIEALEIACKEAVIEDDKTKANFGNLCIALRGHRMVADATEAILIKENILKDEKGDFYKKIDYANLKESLEDTEDNQENTENGEGTK